MAGVNELYSIGDVARRTGLSVSAIRFYADEGIVTPTAASASLPTVRNWKCVPSGIVTLTPA